MYETLSYLPTLLLEQPYESYIAEHLFHPLNMSASVYSVATAEASGNMAHGYMRSMRDEITGINGTLIPAVPYFSRPGEEQIWAGAGGVITSARDLSMWVAMLLGNGQHPFTNSTIVPNNLVKHVAEGVSVVDGTTSYPELVSPRGSLSMPFFSMGCFCRAYRCMEPDRIYTRTGDIKLSTIPGAIPVSKHRYVCTAFRD